MPRASTPTDPPLILIRDFRPGIADSPSSQYPPGQAQRTNTYRCIANESGSLQPLFGASTSYPGTDFNSGVPQGGGAYVVDGMFVAGPVLPSSATSSGKDGEIFLGVEYTTASQRIHKLEWIRVDENPVARTVLRTETMTDASSGLNGWGMTWGTTRMNHTTPTLPGIPVVIAAWGSASSVTPTADGSYVLQFPDDTAPSTTGTYDIAIDGNAQALVTCHQNRVVMRRVTSYGHGAQALWATTENLYFTNANDTHTINGPQVFVPEQPDGYPVMAAMSANELFALKQSGGLVVSGDIESPTVVNLPLVAGAASSSGAYTRIGFMYPGSTSGLWLWAHGDTSENLGSLMDDDFYKITPELLIAQRYQWDCIDNLAFLSNNFVYDTDTHSFWRLDDPSVKAFRFMGHRLNNLYGAISTYLPSALTTIYSYDTTTPALSFSWQSHPIWETIDRRVDYRSCYIRASGSGTVTVTLSVANSESSPITTTFAVTSTTPFIIRNNISIKGQALIVRIESSGTTAAPTVYELGVEPSERERIQTANA